MERRFWINRFGLAALLAAFVCAPALADETVSVGGSRAVLIKPKAAPRASVILLPGGDGSIRAGDHGDIHALLGNQLVRTRQAYAASGLAVLVADATTDLSSAVSYMAAIKSPITVIATSRGTIRAAEGIARGARPDALVLTSGRPRGAAAMSCRSSARRHRCRTPSSSIIVRIVAGPHCRPGLIRSSNGRQAARA
jgi:hypothetical protein